MRRALLTLAAALLLGAAPLALQAAPPDAATLVADTVYIDAAGRLTAEGAVQAFHGTTRLSASRIIYDPKTERLDISGPITVVESGGQMIVLASAADMSRDMSEGLLTGARIVLERQMQIAATEIARVSGRFTRASRVRASSCEVCANNPVPLWEIRASRVIHDQVERQLYFDNAQFRVAGLPLFWLPHLRMPDPTLTRARGFLVPSLRSTSGLGSGVKLPYFLPLGPSRDVTITPYLSTSRTRTVELRYREAFRTGMIEFNGALSRDDLEPDKTRGYLFGAGTFALPRGFQLTFGIEAISDDAYLTDYGISDKDRLKSGVAITRTRRDEYIMGQIAHYQTLRFGETDDTIPSLVGDFTWYRRFQPAGIGGDAGLRFDSHSHLRTSDLTTDANGDGVIDGRDVARATVQADWRRDWVLGNGMILSGMSELTADLYAISQDPAYPSSVARLTPALAVELRWPWVRPASTAQGASWVIEPTAQLAWSPNDPRDVPNEDSVVVEFDEGNLFALSRFPGADRYEAGLRANLGVTVTRQDPDGWSAAFALGRVVREQDPAQFRPATGLDGTLSDWLLASQLSFGSGLTLTNRAIFDDSLTFARDELRLAWRAENYAIASSYLWMTEDAAEARLVPTSEWLVQAQVRLNDTWATAMETRYDFEADRAGRAGVGLQYANECVTVDLSLSRRFTSSTSVRPTTNFDLSVVLNGFGGSSRTAAAARRSCGG